jgi:hypothetical protein
MLARSALACSLLLLMTTTLPGQEDAAWKEKSYAEQGFAILFPPGNTANSSNTRTTKYGSSQVTVHVVVKGNDGFAAGTQSYTAKTTKGKSAEQMLDICRNESAQEVQGRLVSEKKIKLDKKYPGRELQIVAGDGKTIRARIFWANQKMYLTMVMGSEAFVGSADAEKFLGSFKLLPKDK